MPRSLVHPKWRSAEYFVGVAGALIRIVLVISFEVAALGRPVALSKMSGVASPNHERWLTLADGAEDVVAATE